MGSILLSSGLGGSDKKNNNTKIKSNSILLGGGNKKETPQAPRVSVSAVNKVETPQAPRVSISALNKIDTPVRETERYNFLKTREENSHILPLPVQSQPTSPDISKYDKRVIELAKISLKDKEKNLNPSVGEIQQRADKIIGKVQAGEQGGLNAALNKFAGSASLGLYDTLSKKLEKSSAPGSALVQIGNQTEKENIKKHPIVATVGEIAGYSMPMSLSMKASKAALAPVLNKTGSELAKRVITGSAAMGTMGAAEGTFRGESPSDIAKRAALDAALGAGGEVAIHGITKGGSKLLAGMKKGNRTQATGQAVPTEQSVQNAGQPAGQGGDITTAAAKFNYEPAKKASSFKEKWLSLREHLSDKYARAEDIERELTGGLASAENSFYKQARLSAGAPEKVANLIDFDLKPIISSVEKKGYTYKDLGMYAEAIHAKDVNAAGKVSGLTNSEISDIITKLGTPEMEAARKKLVQYSDDRLQQLVKDEVISSEAYVNMKNKWKNYMPLSRYFDDDKIELGKGLSQAFASVASPIKALQGSERTIIDPIESMIKNTYAIESAAARNRVGLEMSKLAPLDNGNKFVRKLESTEAVDRMNVITVKEHGIPVQYELEPGLYKMMKDMNKESSNLALKMLAVPANVLRAGATLTPEFALRNPLRDVLNATILSKSGFNPFTDFAKGLYHYAKKDKMYQDFIRSNGGYGNIISMDRVSHRKALNDILKQPVSKHFVNIVNPKAWLKVLRTISEATESATKIGEFGKALKKGASMEEAAYRARDLMDFARSGSSVQPANKIVAFLNANIQGKSKFIRELKERPAEVTAKLAAVMAVPTVAIYALNEKFANEKQKQLIADAPSWLKDTFWMIAIPGTDVVARLPKPFEGAFVANSIDRSLDYFSKNDKHAFDGFLKDSVKEQSLPNMIAGLTPIIEGIANYSFFRQTSIIPQREKNLLPQDQYDIYTSDLSRKIGRVVQKLPGIGESNFASPRVIENTIRTSTAGLGGLALDTVDTLSATKDKPAKNFEQLPVIKGFTVNPTSTGKSLDWVYSEFNNINKERTSFKRKNPKAEFPQEEKYQYYNQATQLLSDLSASMRQVQNSKLSAEQKQQILNSLADKRNELSIKFKKVLQK